MAVATEESPLLAPSSNPEILKHDLLYQRFSPSQKRTIVALISYGAVIPCEYLNISMSRLVYRLTGLHAHSLDLWVVHTLYSRDR